MKMNNRRIPHSLGILPAVAFPFGAVAVLIVLSAHMTANDHVEVLQQEAKVFSVAFSPDVAFLASGSDDATIKVHDVKSWKELATLVPPEGRFLGYEKSRGTIYDPIKGRRPPCVYALAFSPNGKMLAIGAMDDSVRLWDTESRKQVLKIDLDPSGPYQRGNAVRGVAFSPDNKIVASASDDGIVRLWSAESGKLVRTLKGHKDFAYAVVFSTDGKLIASSSADNTIKVWDSASGELKQTLQGHNVYVNSVAFSPNGRFLASGGGEIGKDPIGELKLWDLSSGKEIANLKGFDGMIRSVTFSPNAKLLASGGGNDYGQLGEVILWDVDQKKKKNNFTGHKGIVMSVAFSPDGKWLASGSSDKTVRVVGVAASE
jgi:WD40 repeat protein